LSGRGVDVVVMCAYLLSLRLVVLASDANTDEERTPRERDRGSSAICTSAGGVEDPITRTKRADQRSQASDRVQL
jgi:hypothetical protein